MAFYTDVDRKTLTRFLADNYNLGGLVDFAGIPEGVQNTNYYVKTDQGKFILTLFERRTPEKDLPYFLNLMKHLKSQGLPCPLPIDTRSGQALAGLHGKPAVFVTFLPGKSIPAPNPAQCFSAGEMISKLHFAGKDFKKTRESLFSPKRVENIYENLKIDIAKTWPEMQSPIEEELNFQTLNTPKGLPSGTIHADIFPDNVFFEGDKVTGLIDFYFSCTDFLAFDLAVSLNCWCFTNEGALKKEHFKTMLAGYESIRPLEKSETLALPLLLRRAALSFLMSRIEYVSHTPPKFLGLQNDPKEFMNILANLQKRRHIKDYF